MIFLVTELAILKWARSNNSLEIARLEMFL